MNFFFVPVYSVHAFFLQNSFWDGENACCVNCKFPFGKRIGDTQVVLVDKTKLLATIPLKRVISISHVRHANDNIHQTRFDTLQLMETKVIGPDEIIEVVETDALSGIELTRK